VTFSTPTPVYDSYRLRQLSSRGCHGQVAVLLVFRQRCSTERDSAAAGSARWRIETTTCGAEGKGHSSAAV